MLKQLKLQEQLASRRDIGGNLAAAQRKDRCADHPAVQKFAGGYEPAIVEISHGATLAIRVPLRQSAPASDVPDHAEALMRRRRIRRDTGPRGDPVAVAVALVTEERSAF